MFAFCSHITRQAQYEHPCAPQYNPLRQQQLLQQMQRPPLPSASAHQALYSSPLSSSVASVAALFAASNQPLAEDVLGPPILHTQFHQPHVLVPANPYLHEGTLS